MLRRAILIVLDSVGIGALPDAHLYGDEGSHTLGNICRIKGDIQLPHLTALGLGNIEELTGIPPVRQPLASYGKMAEYSAGKDTITGHWEIAGIFLSQPLRTFPQGFPQEFIDLYEQAIGRGVLGNEVASGTEIIQRLGEEHRRTGKPIVYTSADSVFQVAAHEEVIPLPELMRLCQIAREMLMGEMTVGRVIARPFLGETAGNFYRTGNRHDLAIEPPGKTLLEYIAASGLEVMAVGKISDIYSGRGVTQSAASKNNMESVEQTLAYMKRKQAGLIMANLTDFDMLYGHRNDVEGYARALEEFDARLPEIMAGLEEEDLLVITADHGCDPSTPSTDHSREYAPLLVYGKKLSAGVSLGTRASFADLGATVAEHLRIPALEHGNSFYHLIEGGKRYDDGK
ncbi:MAG: phosphopentomutase [Peptococcaceae bacterium]|jgi:phosphopentomutase|nr:phosphopentomutase [Peptococcaceae bacterium]